MIDYDGVYWRKTKCEKTDDVAELASGSGPWSHTIRRYTFYGAKVAKTEKTYKGLPLDQATDVAQSRVRSLFGRVAMRTVLIALVIVSGCGSKSGSGADAFGTGDDGTITGGGSGVVITGDGGSWTCYPVLCAGKSLECNDCIDNDQDGESDSHDRECLGPCDNTEGPGLESGVGGTGGNSCGVDCYFDFGNGPGNDECLWDHRCDMFEPEASICEYDASMLGTKDCPATQDPLCAQICGPFTPNGCDCFGCCTMPNAGPGGVGSRNVWIGALDENNSNTPTCTFADIADETKCPTCTPVDNCYNSCLPCEICIGAPLPDPNTCATGGADGGVGMQCPTGYQVCGLPGQAECPMGSYCVTGCCQAVLL